MKKTTVVILFVILSLLLQGCSTAVKEPEKVKVQLLPFFSYAPLYIAQEEGYFAEEGLEVEFQNLRGSAAFVALASGEIDVAATHLTSNTFTAIQQGENVKVVADKGYVAPTGCTVNGLLARSVLVESGELSEPEDMAGRKIEYSQTSVQAYFLEKLLEKGGLTLEDVEHADFDSQALTVEAFDTGAVDMVVESEPWITRIENTGNAVTWVDFKDIIPDFQVAYIIFGPNMLEKNPDAGRRFTKAYLKAVQQYNEGKTERNMELMQSFTEMDAELIDQMCWPTFRDGLAINTQSVLDFQGWAVGQGQQEEVVQVEAFWDPSFVEHALKTAE